MKKTSAGSMEEVSFTYTGILRKGKEKIVRFRFARNGERDYAEGVIPGGCIETSKGFTQEELASLRFYLKTNEAEIMQKAKEISGLRGFLRG